MLTQGLRPNDDRPAGGSISWMEALYRRLTGSFASLPSGVKTAASERILGIERSVYYYVHRAVPAFGDLVVGFEIDVVGDDPRLTSPFDSGGLARDHMVLDPPRSTELEKQELLNDLSFSGALFAKPMSDWIDSSYEERPHYVHGARPSEPFFTGLQVEQCADRAWTWESRVPAYDYADFALRPRVVFIKSGQKRLYTRWLKEVRLLDSEETKLHISEFENLSTEVSRPAEVMTELLAREI